MNVFLSTLSEYASKGTLVPAEQILTNTLIDFEKYLDSLISNITFSTNSGEISETFDKIESALLGLLNINKGTLSFQCSVRISTCLLILYLEQAKSSKSPPKLWNLFSIVSNRPNPSNVIAIGYIIDKIGNSSKSMISGLVQKLISSFSSSNSELHFPILYTLKQCYKRDRVDLDKYSAKTFAIAKKLVSNNNEHIVLSSINLLSTLVKQSKSIPQKKFLTIATDVLKNSNSSSFVVDQICYLIAKIAYFPLSYIEEKIMNEGEKEEKDFVVSGSSKNQDPSNYMDNLSRSLFRQSFGIMSEYLYHFSAILYHFLNLVDPQIICKNLSFLFKTIRHINQSDISHLMSLFGPDTRKELFDIVSNEKPAKVSQLNLLMLLKSNKEGAFHELSALAMQLSSSNDLGERLAGSNFFSILAEVQPEHALLYLETAMLYLATPPDSNPNLENDLHGFSLIAAKILEKVNDKNAYANKVSSKIEIFLQRSLVESSHFLSASYSGAFCVMSALPDYLIPVEDVTESVQKFMKFISTKFGSDSSSSQNENADRKLKYVVRMITKFFSDHENHPMATNFFTFVISHQMTQTREVLVSICKSAPKIMSQTSQILTVAKNVLPRILAATPSIDYIRENIKNPMISINNLICNSIPDILSSTVDNSKNDDSDNKNDNFSYQILTAFPELVQALPPQSVENYIQSIINYTNNPLMMQTLILSICTKKDSAVLLSKTIPSIIISTMKDEQNLVRLQILAEIIGKWINANDGFLSDVLSITRDLLGNKQKCFIYSAILGNVNIENSVIVHIMNDLDNIALRDNNDNVSIYALHALSVLYHVYAIQLAEMKVADIQLNVILSLLNTEKAVEPYSLNYISSCFINLLPVLSADARNSDSHLVPSIKLAAQAFKQIRVPFSRLIMFRALRAVFIFVKEIADDTEMIFPSSKGSSLILQTVACGAFSDMLKIGDISSTDYFDMIPRVLIILQRTQENSVADFIQSIASDFAHKCNVSDENTIKRINEWIFIIKTILISNALPLYFSNNNNNSKSNSNINNTNNNKNEKNEKNDDNINNKNDKSVIESNDRVKQCALSVAKSIVPLLAKCEPVLSECLDDIMTSITRAIETKRTKLMNSAYELLVTVITNFEKVLVEGGQRLLELYESQFSIAVRLAFSTDLAFSGPMLIKYIDFQLVNIRSNIEDFLVLFSLYIEGLFFVRKNTNAFYFSIATHICHILATHHSLYDLVFLSDNLKSSEDTSNKSIKSYKDVLIVQLCEVISISMALWRSDPEDWDQISNFRQNFSSSYGEILTSFIWLQTKLEVEYLSTNSLFHFYLNEIKNGKEYWRINAAFSALTAIIQFSSDSISLDELNEALDFVEQNYSKDKEKQQEKSEDKDKKTPTITFEIVPLFKKACTLFLHKNIKNGGKLGNSNNGNNWIQLLSFTYQNLDEFDLESFASLLNDGSSDDIEHEFVTVLDIIKHFFTTSKEEDKNSLCLALFTIIMEKSNKQIENLLKFLSDPESRVFIPLKFDLYRRLLKRIKFDNDKKIFDIDIDKHLPPISLFSWMNFKHGGMSLISQILIDNPEIGIKMFTYDNFKTIAEISLTDCINCEVYLEFITFGFQIYKKTTGLIIDDNHNNSVDIAVSKVSFLLIIKWSEDLQKGSDIAMNAVILLNTILNEGDSDSVKSAFTVFGTNEQRIIIDQIEKQIIKIENKKKVQNLMVFSSNRSRRTQDDGEWQSLDGSDDDF